MPLRVDLVMETLNAEEGGESTGRLVPDPRRYEMIEQCGELLYLDRYLGYVFPLQSLAEGFCEGPGVPMYWLAPRINSSLDYAEDRRIALNLEVKTGDYVPPTETAMPHYELDTRDEERLIGFLSVDICGATAMRQRKPNSFDFAYELFTRELGTVIGQFNGAILKTKGDGFIAFIDHPSFTRASDNLIDMGLTLLAVLHKSINPTLQMAGIETLNIRVGADFGPARLKTFKVQATNFVTKEVVSDALNRAVKIEEACSPNEFWIGRCLYQIIHVGWLERAIQMNFDGAEVGIPGYQSYRVI